MASKVLLTLPSAASFQNHVQNLDRNEFVCMSVNNNIENGGAVHFTDSTKDAIVRIDELQKTIQFLKDEQKHMLCNLHQEIASLQAKNRDLLCLLIFKADRHDLEYHNSVNDNDVKFILTSNEYKKKPNALNLYLKEANNTDVFDLKYTINQQLQEIEYLKEQLSLVSLRNKTHNYGSRQADVYIRELEDKNRDQEKLIRILRKENKDQKLEIENLRKTLSHSIRLNNHIPQNIQITHHVQPQAQLFPTVGAPSTFWCHQNSPVPLSEYQLQRNGINSSGGGGGERASTIPRVSFTLPPVYNNYRQIAVTAPLPSFYSNASYFYSIAQRPTVRSKSSYSNDNVRSSNKNIHNGPNV